MSTPNSNLTPWIDRLWALGYARAAQRQFAPGKLDALAEATVWICDTISAAKSPKIPDYYLTNVLIQHQSPSFTRTSLASFDDDIRPHLLKNEQLRRIDSSRNSTSISVPSHLLDDNPSPLQHLPKLWNEAIRDLGIDSPLDPSPSTVDAPSAAIQHEFHQSLRLAFDSLSLVTSSPAYTLRLKPISKCPVTTAHSVPYVMGYCLPHLSVPRLPHNKKNPRT